MIDIYNNLGSVDVIIGDKGEKMRNRWGKLPSSRREFLRLGAVGAGFVGASATAGLFGAPAASAQTGSLAFTLLGTARAYDSRGGEGPLLGGQYRGVGLGNAGVPISAAAVVMNATVVNTSGGGYLAFSSELPGEFGGYVPGSFSDINWTGTGQILANSVTVGVRYISPGVSAPAVTASTSSVPPYITVFCEGDGGTDFVIDVHGYYE